jgi:hypothetical protein
VLVVAVHGNFSAASLTAAQHLGLGGLDHVDLPRELQVGYYPLSPESGAEIQKGNPAPSADESYHFSAIAELCYLGGRLPPLPFLHPQRQNVFKLQRSN